MNEIFVKCLFEFIGTAVLVLFGDGVVASNVLRKSKGENGGWVVVTIAWGLAVMLGDRGADAGRICGRGACLCLLQGSL